MTALSPPPEPAAPMPLSVMYDHSRKIYDAMLARASKVETAEGTMIVYEGKLTELFKQLHYSVPYYTYIMDSLKRMGCVRQLRRGGGPALSQWEMIQEPSELLYKAVQAQEKVRPGSHGHSIEMLEQQVRQLTSTQAQLVEGHNLLCEQVEMLLKINRQSGRS